MKLRHIHLPGLYLDQSFPEPFRSEPGHYGRAIWEGTERGYLLEMGNCGTGAERGSFAVRLRVHLVHLFLVKQRVLYNLRGVVQREREREIQTDRQREGERGEREREREREGEREIKINYPYYVHFFG